MKAISVPTLTSKQLVTELTGVVLLVMHHNEALEYPELKLRLDRLATTAGTLFRDTGEDFEYACRTQIDQKLFEFIIALSKFHPVALLSLLKMRDDQGFRLDGKAACGLMWLLYFLGTEIHLCKDNDRRYAHAFYRRTDKTLVLFPGQHTSDLCGPDYKTVKQIAKKLRTLLDRQLYIQIRETSF